MFYFVVASTNTFFFLKWYVTLNFIYIRRSAKIVIWKNEGIIEKISYECHDYESVDDGSLS